MGDVQLFKLGQLIGKSESMQKIYDDIIAISKHNMDVLIVGESGTGKELIARAIHQLSKTSGKFVVVNCGAIPEQLVESEFFGHKKGAFTGANKDKTGFIEEAESGAVFLDEVGEIPFNMQTKLLRVLDHYNFSPVGSSKEIKPKVRWICATNRDLRALVDSGKMREDFYHRINVLTVKAPPLKERKDDIPILLDYFFSLYDAGFSWTNLPNELTRKLMSYNWPGNVRELQNCAKRYIATGEFGIKIKPDLPVYTSLEDEIRQLEIKLISEYMSLFNHKTNLVAEALQINLRTLQRKIKKYNI